MNAVSRRILDRPSNTGATTTQPWGRFATIQPVLATCMLACLMTTGCSPWQRAHRTLYGEMAQYPRVTEGRRACEQYRRWAKKEWQRIAAQHTGEPFPSDYASGFIQGFVDQVYAGGPVGPPAVPPRKYWKLGYRNAQGRRAIENYFHGFEHGARVAKDNGYRERATVPSSLFVDSENDSQSATGRRSPAASSPSGAPTLADPRAEGRRSSTQAPGERREPRAAETDQRTPEPPAPGAADPEDATGPPSDVDPFLGDPPTPEIPRPDAAPAEMPGVVPEGANGEAIDPDAEEDGIPDLFEDNLPSSGLPSGGASSAPPHANPMPLNRADNAKRPVRTAGYQDDRHNAAHASPMVPRLPKETAHERPPVPPWRQHGSAQNRPSGNASSTGNRLDDSRGTVAPASYDRPQSKAFDPFAGSRFPMLSEPDNLPTHNRARPGSPQDTDRPASQDTAPRQDTDQRELKDTDETRRAIKAAAHRDDTDQLPHQDTDRPAAEDTDQFSSRDSVPQQSQDTDPPEGQDTDRLNGRSPRLPAGWKLTTASSQPPLPPRTNYAAANRHEPPAATPNDATHSLDSPLTSIHPTANRNHPARSAPSALSAHLAVTNDTAMTEDTMAAAPLRANVAPWFDNGPLLPSLPSLPDKLLPNLTADNHLPHTEPAVPPLDIQWSGATSLPSSPPANSQSRPQRDGWQAVSESTTTTQWKGKR